ncbi:uncharacterized protein LOC123717433 [Pieris brassicae]|uniref:uncharacterized protein LOC123717433 n=1 Tax=Pieris brassicae TaxID=7116 RepID=UPI001E65E89E|nr:uncharacterized protein LOC123717433 [Pieris brassicae]
MIKSTVSIYNEIDIITYSKLVLFLKYCTNIWNNGNPSFFLNYISGKCTQQRVGFNKFGMLAKKQQEFHPLK